MFEISIKKGKIALWLPPIIGELFTKTKNYRFENTEEVLDFIAKLDTRNLMLDICVQSEKPFSFFTINPKIKDSGQGQMFYRDPNYFDAIKTISMDELEEILNAIQSLRGVCDKNHNIYSVLGDYYISDIFLRERDFTIYEFEE